MLNKMDNKEEIGVLVFGHTRVKTLENTLESLKRQNALQYVDLWLDGDQGNPILKDKLLLTKRMASSHQLRGKYYHRGQLGFRKIILMAMQLAVQKYKYIIFIEDDCFPTHDAIDIFHKELKLIENDNEVFSVYGHPFLMGEDDGFCTRFQGWGWATTAEKLKPYVDKLIDCYSMYESDYLDFVNSNLTNDVLRRLNVTPPRLPTDTLKSFFAWDETLALLTAIDKKKHKVSEKRIIYNCGLGGESTHFSAQDRYLKPPFNMVTQTSIWKYF
jgi:hypothetical protein